MNTLITSANASTFGSNTAISSSNAGYFSSNMSIFLSNSVVYASDTGDWASNKILWSSNLTNFASNAADWSSNKAQYSSNTVHFTSNYAYGTAGTQITGKLTFTSNAAVFGSNLEPRVNDPGFIITFAGNTTPAGYLLCDGSAVSRTTYSALLTAISTLWGTGDGTTTFNVPDLRGRTPIGYNATAFTGISARAVGARSGAETHTLSTAEMPSHNHSGSTNTVGDHTHGYNGGSGGDNDGTANVQHLANFWGGKSTGGGGSHSHTVTIGSAGSGSAHNNMQPFGVVRFAIKT